MLALRDLVGLTFNRIARIVCWSSSSNCVPGLSLFSFSWPLLFCNSLLNFSSSSCWPSSLAGPPLFTKEACTEFLRSMVWICLKKPHPGSTCFGTCLQFFGQHKCPWTVIIQGRIGPQNLTAFCESMAQILIALSGPFSPWDLQNVVHKLDRIDSKNAQGYSEHDLDATKGVFETSVDMFTSEHQALGSGLIGGKNDFQWFPEALRKCHPFMAKLLQLVIHTPSWGDAIARVRGKPCTKELQIDPVGSLNRDSSSVSLQEMSSPLATFGFHDGLTSFLLDLVNENCRVP